VQVVRQGQGQGLRQGQGEQGLAVFPGCVEFFYIHFKLNEKKKSNLPKLDAATIFAFPQSPVMSLSCEPVATAIQTQERLILFVAVHVGRQNALPEQ
jgi:hypothetical protein